MPASASIAIKPQGYQLTSDAYVVPMQDARDTLKLIKEQDAELSALHGYVASQDVTVDQLAVEISTLKADLEAERAAWTKNIATLSKEIKRLRSPWAIGLFGGWDAVHQEAAVGVGLTYKLIGL